VESVIDFIPPTQPRGRAEDEIHDVLEFEFALTGAVKKYTYERYDNGRRPL